MQIPRFLDDKPSKGGKNHAPDKTAAKAIPPMEDLLPFDW